MKIDIENAIQQEPVQAIMMLCMRYLTDEQRKIVYEKLGRRIPQETLPTTEEIEQEARELYPQPGIQSSQLPIYQYQRMAHIAAVTKYTERIKELEKHLRHIYDSYSDEWTEHNREWTEKVLNLK